MSENLCYYHSGAANNSAVLYVDHSRCDRCAAALQVATEREHMRAEREGYVYDGVRYATKAAMEKAVSALLAAQSRMLRGAK